MAKKVKANKVINGTFGSVWVNGERWQDIETLELKVGLEYEDVNMPEDLATHKKLTGWTGEGSMTVKKVYSRGSRLLAEATKKGTTPDITIVSKLADPDSYGTERVTVSEVTFNEFLLSAFEQKALGKEELSFSFADFDLLETISS